MTEMTDLDKLIKLESERHDECNETEWLKWHEEYQSLYEKLKKAEEDSIKYQRVVESLKQSGDLAIHTLMELEKNG